MAGSVMTENFWYIKWCLDRHKIQHYVTDTELYVERKSEKLLWGCVYSGGSFPVIKNIFININMWVDKKQASDLMRNFHADLHIILLKFL